jgi:cyclin-dependent kinase 12/13
VLRDVNVFLKKHQVGQGTYGYVYCLQLGLWNLGPDYTNVSWKRQRSVFVGKDKETNEIVALKRINTEQEENGFPITAIREVKILKALRGHENIVNLKEIVTSKGEFLVIVRKALAGSQFRASLHTLSTR